MRKIISWTIVAALVTLPVPLGRLWRVTEIVKLPQRTTSCAAGEVIRKK